MREQLINETSGRAKKDPLSQTRGQRIRGAIKDGISVAFAEISLSGAASTPIAGGEVSGIRDRQQDVSADASRHSLERKVSAARRRRLRLQNRIEAKQRRERPVSARLSRAVRSANTKEQSALSQLKR